jgi:hypothetical protein
VQRRGRVKVEALVMPSPVVPAIDIDVKPTAI